MALVIGMNSGSSFDGIDAVLFEIALGDDGQPTRPRFIDGLAYDYGRGYDKDGEIGRSGTVHPEMIDEPAREQHPGLLGRHVVHDHGQGPVAAADGAGVPRARRARDRACRLTTERGPGRLIATVLES